LQVVYYSHPDGKNYNLESLCLSEGQRILFFPGFRSRDLLWKINKKGDFKKFNPSDFSVDHFTLERNLKKMHLTLLGKNNSSGKEYPATFKSLKIDGGIYFWFGLHIQEPSVLEPTPGEISVTFSTPSSDVKRRMLNKDCLQTAPCCSAQK